MVQTGEQALFSSVQCGGDLRPGRTGFRPEKADFRPEKADFRPERADFRPERAWEGTDERTNE